MRCDREEVYENFNRQFGARPPATGQLLRESDFTVPLEELATPATTPAEASNRPFDSSSAPVVGAIIPASPSTGDTHDLNKVVFYLIAALLFFTAIAKLWMLITDPFAEVRVGISKEILWFSVLFELGLVYLNIQMKDLKILAFINTLVFTSFGLFAASRWLLGQGSCGCSGNLELPVWGFVLIDGMIVGIFTGTSVARRRFVGGFKALASRLSSVTSGLNWIGLSLGFLIAGCGLLVLSKLNAEKPIQAESIDFGTIKWQELSVEFGVQIQNRSSIPVNVVGVNSSCECLALVDRHFRILPDSKVEIEGVARFKKLGKFHNRLVFFLDHPQQRTAVVDVFGNFE